MPLTIYWHRNKNLQPFGYSGAASVSSPLEGPASSSSSVSGSLWPSLASRPESSPSNQKWWGGIGFTSAYGKG